MPRLRRLVYLEPEASADTFLPRRRRCQDGWPDSTVGCCSSLCIARHPASFYQCDCCTCCRPCWKQKTTDIQNIDLYFIQDTWPVAVCTLFLSVSLQSISFCQSLICFPLSSVFCFSLPICNLFLSVRLKPVSLYQSVMFSLPICICSSPSVFNLFLSANL